MLVAGWDENAVSITTVEGFTSLQACQQAGKMFEKADSSTAYRNKFTCLEVK